ncbi:MAG: peptide chain release factor N(5)-glutamine methyltransferase [Beijerinckiaceae bacterium]|nr:peptide chain release factor N(5)-glutamine methyltransferase [Beijerinckiaceae bacterium]
MTAVLDLPQGANLQAAREWAAAAFAAAGIAQSCDDAAALLCHAAGLRRIDFLNDPGRVLTPSGRAVFSSHVQRRLAREPVTRIIGTRGFWDIDLDVAPGVLDPRADTETLVEAAVALLGGRTSGTLRILDLGCGSGAIICALLHAWPHAIGHAMDISQDACALTRRNASRCGVADRLTIDQRSWNHGLDGQFDLVLSNPPYIRSGALASLDPEVRLWDPVLALDGGADGLDAYRDLAVLTAPCLASGGWLVLEAGFDQAADITNILVAAGWVGLQTYNDLGGHVRAIAARCQQSGM